MLLSDMESKMVLKLMHFRLAKIFKLLIQKIHETLAQVMV